MGNRMSGTSHLAPTGTFVRIRRMTTEERPESPLHWLDNFQSLMERQVVGVIVGGSRTTINVTMAVFYNNGDGVTYNLDDRWLEVLPDSAGTDEARRAFIEQVEEVHGRNAAAVEEMIFAVQRVQATVDSIK